MKALSDVKIQNILKCPVCGSHMAVSENKTSLICLGQRRHCYDFAASGYVNLCSPTHSNGGDSKQAVRARGAFLDLGYYTPVAEALAKASVEHGTPKGIVLDAGCGEGFYSRFLAAEGFSVIGVDLSKFAVDAAAKRLFREGIGNQLFATASVFELPVFDSSVDVITNVFAPCVETEYSRALKHDGVLLVAHAGEEHLMGLKSAIYENTHLNTQRADLPTQMQKIDEIRVRYDITLNSNKEIMDLFSMTPYYWKTSVEDGKKLSRIDKLETEVDIIISAYKKKTDF